MQIRNGAADYSLTTYENHQLVPESSSGFYALDLSSVVSVLHLIRRPILGPDLAGIAILLVNGECGLAIGCDIIYVLWPGLGSGS